MICFFYVFLFYLILFYYVILGLALPWRKQEPCRYQRLNARVGHARPETYFDPPRSTVDFISLHHYYISTLCFLLLVLSNRFLQLLFFYVVSTHLFSKLSVDKVQDFILPYFYSISTLCFLQLALHHPFFFSYYSLCSSQAFTFQTFFLQTPNVDFPS